ncbi:MAG: histidine kinase [Chloroflexota bacterium]|nr:histidine kinase [Chloroflexota bacterium]
MAAPENTRILLIEDNPGDAWLIKEMLRKVPELSVVAAETLSEGIECCQQYDCQLALLDLSLPDSSGVDTVLSFRALLPQTPLVVFTGLDSEQLGVEAVQAGAQDYLVKGETDSRALQRAVRYALERHRIEEALRRSEQEYRSLIDDVFNTSAVGVLILDRSLTVVWMNEATALYFGIARDEVIGQNKRTLIDNKLKCLFADPDDYATRLFAAYDTDTFTDRFECHVTPGQGRQDRWLEHWSQPIRQGMYAGGRIEQYTDITDRKHAEFAEQEQRRFAEALRETAETLSSSLEFDDVMDLIIENVGRVVPNDGVSIVVYEDTGKQIVRSQGGNILESHEMMRLSSPIILQEKEIGVIKVFSKDLEDNSNDMLARLRAFAAQAAVAIQNARVYHQSQDLAIAQERRRLARELHDSVSQTLFSSQSMTEAALRQWQTQPERAHELIEEVYRMLASALAEMRILLLELRPTALTQIGLKQLFEQYLQTTLSKQNIMMQLEMEDVPPLPPDVQIALYRIIQEAANNVIKHAQARHIRLTALQENHLLELSLVDDGRGFSADEQKATSMGLNIMRERARTIGADLTIKSQRGKGTQVTVSWKISQAEGSHDG